MASHVVWTAREVCSGERSRWSGNSRNNRKNVNSNNRNNRRSNNQQRAGRNQSRNDRPAMFGFAR
ncbi:hypothetical protein CA54_46790 [Symmachiella macrocystis]|uniref:Uncharacterized protein n=1 Tax=Symmachiella macrocystis TaxID=2527985 RepID=A0A5C6BCV8_9PLAN|nr:hypothetical protein CA54_46790 [Symmachiella macrocystis]